MSTPSSNLLDRTNSQKQIGDPQKIREADDLERLQRAFKARQKEQDGKTTELKQQLKQQQLAQTKTAGHEARQDTISAAAAPGTSALALGGTPLSQAAAGSAAGSQQQAITEVVSGKASAGGAGERKNSTELEQAGQEAEFRAKMQREMEAMRRLHEEALRSAQEQLKSQFQEELEKQTKLLEESERLRAEADARKEEQARTRESEQRAAQEELQRKQTELSERERALQERVDAEALANKAREKARDAAEAQRSEQEALWKMRQQREEQELQQKTAETLAKQKELRKKLEAEAKRKSQREAKAKRESSEREAKARQDAENLKLDAQRDRARTEAKPYGQQRKYIEQLPSRFVEPGLSIVLDSAVRDPDNPNFTKAPDAVVTTQIHEKLALRNAGTTVSNTIIKRTRTGVISMEIRTVQPFAGARNGDAVVFCMREVNGEYLPAVPQTGFNMSDFTAELNEEASVIVCAERPGTSRVFHDGDVRRKPQGGAGSGS